MDEPLSNLDAKLRVQMRTQVSRIQKSLGTTTLYVTHDQTEAMTLGDRVVVMRGGVVQQVGSPSYLYDHPNNLFVAGFIGSPSMNFLPGQLEGGGTRARRLWARSQLPDRCRQAVERSKSSGNVIMGIRPEHFEDASLVGDKPGATFDAPIDIVEAMGSDVYAYFTVKGEEAHSADLDDLAKDTGQRPAQRRRRRSRPGSTPPRTSSAGRRPGSGTTPPSSRCSTPRPGRTWPRAART